MKKFKNIKLMLIGLFCLMGMNVWAQAVTVADIDRYAADKGMLYGIVSATGETWFVGVLDDDPSTGWKWNKEIVVPKEVNLDNATATGKIKYTVLGIADSWYTSATYGTLPQYKTQAVAAADVKKVKIECRLDGTTTNNAIGSGWKTLIGGMEYSAWTALEELEIDNAHGVSEISFKTNGAFPALKTLNLSGVKNDDLPIKIAEELVKAAPELTKVVLPTEDPIIIGKDAFLSCVKLSDLNLADAEVTEIGQGALYNTGLTTLTIPAPVETIKQGAFGYNSKLATVNILSTELTEILGSVPFDGRWFEGCDAITTININSGSITKIAAGAFASATGLQNLTIAGGALTTVEDGAFADLTSLVNVDLEGTKLKSVATICVPKKSANKLEVFKFPTDLEGTLPSFEDCKKLKEISTIPAGVNAMPTSGFKNCVLLTAIDLRNIKSIPASAFEMTDKITDPKKAFVKGIQQYNTALAAVTLNAETYEINANAFKNCSKLSSVNLATLTKLKKVDDYAFFGTIIPNSSVTLTACAEADFKAIGNYAFADNTALSEVTLAPNIETIGKGAFSFSGLDSKTKKTLGGLEKVNGLEGNAKIKTIDDYAFQGAAWTAIDLSGNTNTSFTTIHEGAFYDNSNLATVVLPTQIATIEPQAFCYAVALSSINLNETDITVLNNLFTTDANSDEISLDALTELDLKKSTTKKLNDKPLKDLTEIKDYALQFTGIEKFVMPESVQKFGTNVFQGCLSLTEFTWENVYESILTLPTNTFRGDIKLEKVLFLTKGNATQPIKDKEVFFLCDKSILTVTVTPDLYNFTVAAGYGNDNRTYSTLDYLGNKKAVFNEKAKKASDGYYYATYYNEVNSSWFDATKFDVYSAVVEGNKVVLKKATADGGFYKIGKQKKTTGGLYTDFEKTVCVVRSTDNTAMPQLNSNEGSAELSTLGNNELRISNEGSGSYKDKGSKLNYVFKLAQVGDNVAFYRVTSGTFAKGKVYIEADPSAARLDIVIEGEGEVTGIENLFSAEEVEDNAPVYNLQGAQVKVTKKGMYIKNGKKFIVK